MKRLLVLLLFAVPILAQDASRPLTIQECVSEVGLLHFQLNRANEQIASLKATVQALQDENAKLKAAK